MYAESGAKATFAVLVLLRELLGGSYVPTDVPGKRYFEEQKEPEYLGETKYTNLAKYSSQTQRPTRKKYYSARRIY